MSDVCDVQALKNNPVNTCSIMCIYTYCDSDLSAPMQYPDKQ